MTTLQTLTRAEQKGMARAIRDSVIDKLEPRLDSLESRIEEVRGVLLKEITAMLEKLLASHREETVEAIKAIPTPVMKQTIETPAAKVEVNLPALSPTPVNLVMPDQKAREKRFVKDDKGEIVGTKEVD